MEITSQWLKDKFIEHGSLKAVLRMEPDVPSWWALQRAYKKAVDEGVMGQLWVGAKSKEDQKNPAIKAEPEPKGEVHGLNQETQTLSLPPKGKISRYFFTCAQNGTKVHKQLFDNLKALMEHYEVDPESDKVDLFISRFTYMRTGLGASGDKSSFIKREKFSDGEGIWFVPELSSYLSDRRIEVAPGLVWCGEMNILPTATRPLSGLETFTGRKSGIFPHVKIALESIPGGVNEPTKFNYTTGTITLKNYIQRKAGLKAEFHHSFGCLMVEVDSDGRWFPLQINADSEGTIYDRTIRVKNGIVDTDVDVEGITHGDCHVAQMDPDIYRVVWGKGGVVDTLRPRVQFLHDILDFQSKNHHEVNNPFMQYKRFLNAQSNVREEVEQVSEFLTGVERDFCQTIVISSNHDYFLTRWLKEQDGRRDPQNFEFWLAMNRSVLNAIKLFGSFDILDLALGEVGYAGNALIWPEDDSYVLCADAHGGIECAMHGHLGPKGSRGTPQNLARLGRRANTGHTHTAQIIDGLYVAGTYSVLRPDYVRGPSSWSHSLILTYENGKRAICTIWKGKWRAEANA